MELSFKSFLSPMCETRELHTDSQLRTRYYRNNFKQIIEALKTLAKENQMEVREVNEVHKEIYMIGNGFDVIITVSLITPIEAGVDLKINVFSAIGMGKPKKRALMIYEELKKLLNFKGISLHP